MSARSTIGIPDKGMSRDPDTPRFSTGYGDVRRLPTVLVENHSLKPYRQRVLGTYVLVEEALRQVGEDGAALRAAIESDRRERPAGNGCKLEAANKPIYTIDFLGVANDRYKSVASGRDEIRWLGRPIRQRMPVIGQAPDKKVTLPKAWWVPVSEPDVIDRLMLHGVEFQTLNEPRVIELDMVRLADPKLGQANEGHIPLTARFIHAPRRETFPAGSIRVPSDQPLGLLAAAMLEPESANSLLAWNYFPESSSAPNIWKAMSSLRWRR